MSMNSTKEQIPFWKWWEGKRMITNVGYLILIGYFSYKYYLRFSDLPGNSIVDPERLDFHMLKLPIISFVGLNIMYSLFSIISFLFHSLMKKAKLDFFTENKMSWRVFFLVQFILAIFILLIFYGWQPPIKIRSDFYFY